MRPRFNIRVVVSPTQTHGHKPAVRSPIKAHPAGAAGRPLSPPRPTIRAAAQPSTFSRTSAPKAGSPSAVTSRRIHFPARRHGRGQRRKMHVKAEKRPGCNSSMISRQAVSAARRKRRLSESVKPPHSVGLSFPVSRPKGQHPQNRVTRTALRGRTTIGRHSSSCDSPTDTEHVLYNNIGQVILSHNSPPVGEY